MKSSSGRSTGEVASLLLGDDSIHDDEEEKNSPSLQTNAPSSGIVKKSFDNENISTIDWRADYKKEKKKRARIFEQQGVLALLQQAYYASQGWIMTVVVGITVGIAASLVDKGMEWVSGFREGVCVNWFLATEKRCCVDIPVGVECPYWRTWSQLFGILDPTGAYAFNYFAYIFTAAFMSVLAAWLVKCLAPWAAGSGIPEVKTILGGFVIKGFLGIWTFLVKVVGLILAVGSGLTTGKEGPMVHVGGCVGNIGSRLFSKYRNNEAKKREIISASCAAGVACAFGTPAGGTLFSLEELSSYFPPKTLFRTFFTCVIGALTLQVLNPRPSGKIVLFSISYHVNWKWFELLPFIFMGILGGILGALWTKLNITYIKYVRKRYLKDWPITEALMTSVVTSLLCYWNEYSRIPMSDLIAMLFQNTCTENSDSEEIAKVLCDPTNFWPLGKLIISFVLRFILMFWTVGIKVPGGILVPALMIGACYGQVIGSLMKYIQIMYPDSLFFQECYAGGEGSCIVPGIYAVVGAASMLGGICRITVSLAVIMFELTGGLEYLVPLMLSTMFAKWVGDAFDHVTIYEHNIEMSEYPFLHNDEVDHDGTAQEIMTTHSLKVIYSEGVTIGDVKTGLLTEETKIYGFPIIDNSSDRRVLGFISQAALRDAIKENERRINDQTEIFFEELLVTQRQEHLINKIDLSNYLDEVPIQVPTQMPGDRVYNMFRAMGIRYCLVLHSSKLVGIITKKDLARWLHHSHHGTLEKRSNTTSSPTKSPQALSVETASSAVNINSISNTKVSLNIAEEEYHYQRLDNEPQDEDTRRRK
ncbi:hypothetical protein C9374_010519 [Naegleria lovaniensis]|uniref:Chloride channel protein n=1 Tax=Naegleria lovaniensis TaxID=51637 RepID=A0AA88GBT7_NAELO|nr:uncharacterized protein C9374_010519 [Naegleria lovaniensis]KAG2374775.1 hypothetical protein C9374_010519 [Naegleria lovaniensis]